MPHPNFNRIARPYHLLERLSFGPALTRARLHYLPEVLDARRILALGDGDGRFLAHLLQHTPHLLRADAVDLSPQMLHLLNRRCQQSSPPATYRRLHLHCTDALTYLHNRPETLPPFDLVVTHFFLDCLAEPDLRRLLAAATPHLTPDALWLLSDFRIPIGPARLPAHLLVRSLYLAFRVLTGLQTTRLPDHAGALRSAGYLPLSVHHSLGGLLTSELWQRNKPFPNRTEKSKMTSMELPPNPHTQQDDPAPIEPVYDIDPLTPMPHSPSILPPFPLKPHSENPTREKEFISESR